jgi:serine/threonine protein phosphatase PrpC
MIWKVIGQSVIGSSHVQSGKGCEDSVLHQLVDLPDDEQTLVCFASDGAGSAMFAAEASKLAVKTATNTLANWVNEGKELTDTLLIELAEIVYDELKAAAEEKEVPLNEFSCTLLGAIIMPEKAAFLQIGDGAIIRNQEGGNYTHLWWPHNGEYQNTTTFVIDNPNLPNLKTRIINETITELGLFTDGLQMLALNNETESVHQPFFTDLFKVLRMTNSPTHIETLNNRLNQYLASDTINSRTDDDKTLLLATRLGNG